MTDEDIDLTMVDSPPGNTSIVAASSSLLAGGGPSGSDLSVQQQSPTKTQLKEAVEYLEDQVGQTRVQAEEFVQAREREIKQDAHSKVKHIIADQKAQFEKNSQALRASSV